HSKGGGDIITDAQYGNYELRLQWKIAEGANSGIFVGVREVNGAIYFSGVEMQILDNEKHPDAKHEKHVSGSCYGLIKPPAGAAKKAGEWNDVRIVSQDGHYQFFLNGVKTADFKIDSVEFVDLIANSKFKQWPHFARYRKGHIGFQDHGDQVSFKNIRIKELPKK
ncbi:MAG: 3-keto-disaccharide hydrolase, partial [Akkermansiaceae bacterium]